MTPRYWRTPDGYRIDDYPPVDPDPPFGQPRNGKIVLTAWGIDGARVVERGPIVGWQLSSCDIGPVPVTVMLGHEDDEHLGWAVLLPDGRVTGPENRHRDERGRFVSMYAWRYWPDEAAALMKSTIP